MIYIICIVMFVVFAMLTDAHTANNSNGVYDPYPGQEIPGYIFTHRLSHCHV